MIKMFAVTDKDMQKTVMGDRTFYKYRVPDGLKLDLSGQKLLFSIVQKIKVKEYRLSQGEKFIYVTTGYFRKKTVNFPIPTYHLDQEDKTIVLPASGTVSFQVWDCFERMVLFDLDKINVSFAANVELPNNIKPVEPGQLIRFCVEHPGQAIDAQIAIYAKVSDS